jgi:hypothetical protein
MYAAILGDATFHQFLFQADENLAERARQEACVFCGAPLHSANYRRHPRGLPEEDLGPGFDLCFSFCCSRDGCRRRHQAPSVRFLGRRVYLFAIVLLVSAMRQGPARRTARELKALFGVDRRTLARWRTWWQAILPRMQFWRRARGHFRASVREDDLPQSLIDRFREEQGLLRERVVATLKFLCGLFSPLGAF